MFRKKDGETKSIGSPVSGCRVTTGCSLTSVRAAWALASVQRFLRSGEKAAKGAAALTGVARACAVPYTAVWW